MRLYLSYILDKTKFHRRIHHTLSKKLKHSTDYPQKGQEKIKEVAIGAGLYSLIVMICCQNAVEKD